MYLILNKQNLILKVHKLASCQFKKNEEKSQLVPKSNLLVPLKIIALYWTLRDRNINKSFLIKMWDILCFYFLTIETYFLNASNLYLLQLN